MTGLPPCVIHFYFSRNYLVQQGFVQQYCLFVCLFIAAWAIFQLLGGCHNYRWQCCKCRAMAFSSDCSFTCHTCGDTGPRFIRYHPKEWHTHFNPAHRIIRSLCRCSNHYTTLAENKYNWYFSTNIDISYPRQIWVSKSSFHECIFTKSIFTIYKHFTLPLSSLVVQQGIVNCNFVRGFFAHHLYILRSSFVCLGVEKSIFKGIMHFTVYPL
jgi:hypothetical protein